MSVKKMLISFLRFTWNWILSSFVTFLIWYGISKSKLNINIYHPSNKTNIPPPLQIRHNFPEFKVNIKTFLWWRANLLTLFSLRKLLAYIINIFCSFIQEIQSFIKQMYFLHFLFLVSELLQYFSIIFGLQVKDFMLMLF